MSDWSIKITGPKGNGVFTPELPGAKPGDPLDATTDDLVSWNNQTGDPHTITVGGTPITDPIPPGKPSSGYLVEDDPPATIEYRCANHANEVGKINVVVLILAFVLATLIAPALRAQGAADSSC